MWLKCETTPFMLVVNRVSAWTQHIHPDHGQPMMNTRSRFASGSLLFIPLALLVGFVLGGLGPRHELAKAKTEIDWLKTKPSRRGDTSLNLITDVVRIPKERTEEPTRVEPVEESDTTDLIGPSPPPEPTSPSGSETPSPQPAPESLEDQLALAREAWAIRSDIARSTFLSRTGLSGEESIQFDVLQAAMNLRLRASFEKLANLLSAGQEMSPELGIRAINEITGALTVTYDELDRKLPSHWRETAGEDFDLTDFIDPSVAEPLIPVEKKLSERPRDRRRRTR